MKCCAAIFLSLGFYAAGVLCLFLGMIIQEICT